MIVAMRKLTQRATMFADMAKGGYIQSYDIFDGAKRIGGKIVQRKDRTQPQTTTYVLITPGRETDQTTFDNLKDFTAAYEAYESSR